MGFIYKNELAPQIEEMNDLNIEHFHKTPLLLTINWQGQEIHLINLHLKCCDNADKRRLAMIDLKQFIDTTLSDQNVIILGDLNDVLSETIDNENVFQPFIDDIENYYFADMEIALGDPSLWSFPNYPNSWSFPDSSDYTFGSHIDHILITNELFDDFEHIDSHIQTLIMDTSSDNSYFSNSSYNNFISDHRAIGMNLFINTVFELGDMNNDGGLNVIDIIVIVDLILNNNYDVVGDVNEDGSLDILDIVMLVDWVLNQ